MAGDGLFNEFSILYNRAECNVVNEFCCKIYNKHMMYEPVLIPGTQRFSNMLNVQFVVGDKVMCTKNSDVDVYYEEGQFYRFVVTWTVSVTRRLVFFFNIWPFTTMKISLIEKL